MYWNLNSWLGFVICENSIQDIFIVKSNLRKKFKCKKNGSVLIKVFIIFNSNFNIVSSNYNI